MKKETDISRPIAKNLMTHQIIEAADDRFTNFSHALLDTCHLVELSAKGISHLPILYNVQEVIDDYNNDTGQSNDKDKLKKAKEEAEFAKNEVEKGFPFLYGQGAVSIWGQLEAFIEDLLVDCMEKDVELMNNQIIQKVKIVLAQYDSMSEKERKYYILDNLQRDLQSKFKQGVTQFEAILDVFKWSGNIGDKTRKDLFELGNIRNNLVHRRGIADKRLVESCPWLNMKIGDRIKVDALSFHRYTTAIMIYTAVIIKRIIVCYGDKTTRIDNLIKGLLELQISEMRDNAQ
ncbi:MAG TPA: hypothetical protein VMU29_02635 [Smithella sp.]|nr:hypothetical protein [Smithella sp.]